MIPTHTVHKTVTQQHQRAISFLLRTAIQDRPMNNTNTNNMSATASTAAAAAEEGQVIIMRYTSRDVLNGRGQRVQSHPGNIKYRTLVFVNKVSHQ